MAERVAITGGASQNLACMLQVFTDPVFTRNVWIVAPAYMLAFRIFTDSGFGAKMRAVPEDEEGVDVGFLRKEIEKSEKRARDEGNSEPKIKPARPWSKIYRHVIYAVPSFANPSSKTMSLRRREDLVRVAREFDALIITDDVYDHLQWSAKPSPKAVLDKAVLPRIVDVDRYLDGGAERDGADGFGNAASNGSFSKICGPGVRTGWVEGTPKLAWGVSQTGSTRSGGAPSQLVATFLADALESGHIQRHIYSTLQPAYAARYRALVAAMHEHLVPLGARLPQSDRQVAGGYFVWVTLPAALDGATIAERARDDENLIVAQGALFEVPGSGGGGDADGHDAPENAITFPHDVRLCFAWEAEDALEEGVIRLARVMKKMLSGEKSGMRPEPDKDQAGKEPRNFW
ncbi:pyridoxal phosphate-dependent transferase [Lineolata rhizophorae]|uniref:Pyridoxal phosphate-dependent transferase n=1 Tax=Lineolata rhizophorae TaxID=578093 RepID=A0A6A6PD60_9PEZI|nr:pyridoxal phosphate-dependent transferase [Lineolata rhizophorae]